MVRNTLYLAMLTAILISACKTYQADKLPETQLRFGSGGGITGFTTEYTLLKNGQLFVRTGKPGNEPWSEYGKVKKAEAKALYEYWEAHSTLQDEVKQPGNMYRFLTMQKDSTEFRQSWGASGYTPAEPMTTLYEQAMELVKKVETDRVEKN